MLTTILINLLLFLQECQLGANHHVKWNLGKRNLAAWQDVHHVELERLGAFVAHWQDLKPAHALYLLNYLSEVVPVTC